MSEHTFQGGTPDGTCVICGRGPTTRLAFDTPTGNQVTIIPTHPLIVPGEEQAITRTAEQSHLAALAERDALTAQVEALTAWKARATDLLRFFTDDPDDCRLDHNGDCQTHLGGNPCTWAEARTFLNGGDQ